MFGTVEGFAQALTWIINMLFCGALIPQIVLDTKMHSTRGISDGMLFFMYVGYSWNTIYVFCMDMPLAYRIFVPMTFCLALVLVAQRFYYDNPRYSKRLTYAYASHGAGWFAVLPLAFKFPAQMGVITGWAIFVIWILFQLPQLIRLYKTKDTKGFSPLFPGMLLVGMGLELSSGLMLSFPIQSILNSIRAIGGYSLMLYMYYRFKDIS